MKTRGMTLIDTLVGTAMMLIVFLSIFAVYMLATDLVLASKARTGALSLVSQQLEYVRGLPYDSLGTSGGIPSGAIPQSTSTKLNNISYTVRTLIKYIDDPSDGLDAADSNGVTADYKEVKVTASWTLRNRTASVFALTRVSPHGIETLSNGGTLRVNIFDATAAPVPGASIRIQNASTSPTIDETLSSDAGGAIALPGAPAASNYKITVTKSNYSSAQTYDVSGANPNPNPGNVSIANKKTTTASFAIDRTGSLNVLTFSPPGTGTFSDTFANQTKLAATSSIQLSGGDVTLVGSTSTPYVSPGSITSIPIAPTSVSSWDTLSWTSGTPSNTAVKVQVQYLLSGSYVLVSDTDLPGNSAGLQSGTVSLATLSPTTYTSLRLVATLTTTDTSVTPSLSDWQVAYHVGPTPLPNVAFTIHGGKTIGATNTGSPIYKFLQNNTTSSAGQWLITPIEWDTYTITPTGSTYDVSDQCPDPLSVQPAQSQSVSLIMVPHTTNSLRVAVTGSGAIVPGATVAITGASAATTTTSTCGEAFFSGLSTGTYSLSVTATGFKKLVENVSVSATTLAAVALTP